jgi:hypothetical protein
MLSKDHCAVWMKVGEFLRIEKCEVLQITVASWGDFPVLGIAIT